MKRIMALTALASLLALSVLTSQASAQDVVIGRVSADPPTVPAEGEYTFTVTGAGFVPGTSVFVLPCTLPGDPLSPASSAEEIGAAAAVLNPTGGDCTLSNLTPAAIGSDGTFSVEATATVGVNFAWAAGDQPTTQSGFVPVFIVDPDSMVPDGGADTGFGGMAGSDGDSVAVPLAASLAAVILLSGTALMLRRNN